MSIEKRVAPLSRSFGTLIKNTRRMAKHIKDLKDLRALRTPSAIDIKDLKDLREPETFFPQRERWRGTGPRTTGHAEIERSRGTGPRATGPGDDFLRQCIARDRPSRYGPRGRFLMPIQREGQALALRTPGTISYADAMRGTGPRATGTGDDFLRGIIPNLEKGI